RRGREHALVAYAVASGIALAALDRNAARVVRLAALSSKLGARPGCAADAELVGGMKRNAVLAAAALGYVARLPVALAACAAEIGKSEDRDERESKRQRLVHKPLYCGTWSGPLQGVQFPTRNPAGQGLRGQYRRIEANSVRDRTATRREKG